MAMDAWILEQQAMMEYDRDKMDKSFVHFLPHGWLFDSFYSTTIFFPPKRTYSLM
jgi:hypothetical protein